MADIIPTTPTTITTPTTTTATTTSTIPTTTIAAHGPYEDLAIALINLVSKIVDGQSPEVKKELWGMSIEDVKAWRSFFGIGK